MSLVLLEFAIFLVSNLCLGKKQFIFAPSSEVAKNQHVCHLVVIPGGIPGELETRDPCDNQSAGQGRVDRGCVDHSHTHNSYQSLKQYEE